MPDYLARREDVTLSPASPRFEAKPNDTKPATAFRYDTANMVWDRQAGRPIAFMQHGADADLIAAALNYVAAAPELP
jgi:hypothetical protein